MRKVKLLLVTAILAATMAAPAAPASAHDWGPNTHRHDLEYRDCCADVWYYEEFYAQRFFNGSNGQLYVTLTHRHWESCDYCSTWWFTHNKYTSLPTSSLHD